jgi:precorrin-6B C5,15-methyltransferase / cobalt-precorrin-6B C5,C15-methyltransferase
VRGTDAAPWLAVIGLGDDGVSGLDPAARRLIEAAELLVGGERHQAMIPESQAARLTWQCGIASVLDAIAARRGRPVVVLASGDPMWYGAGANLAGRFAADEMTVLPHPGAFSLAAARMGWPLADVETLSVHGRPLAVLNRFLQPGARLLVLSRDGETPVAAARLLVERGFGTSSLTVLEHLGGANERRIDGIAEDWAWPPAADLNTLAIHCRAAATARLLPPVPGLPDDAFVHDGKMTKREARAAAIAALAPLPGQTLWDVGAGAGSVAIEWLRSVPRYRPAAGCAAQAFAIESDGARCRTIAHNAEALGVPDLVVVEGRAPEAFAALPPPNSVFLGGGVSEPGVIDACWQALPAAGRLVAHAVTLEGSARLLELWRAEGGDLVRIAISRAGPVGRWTAFRAAMEVTQLTAVKP